MSEFGLAIEKSLIGEIKEGKKYGKFLAEQFDHRVARERQGWQLLLKYRGSYTQDVLNNIFDTVDESGKHRFGPLLATPNRNNILESGPTLFTQWVEELLFSTKKVEVALNICIEKLRIKRARNGLATLLLYLSDPDSYNVWVPTTWKALADLGRITEYKYNDWGIDYLRFNEAAKSFRDKYELRPQEVDWFLFSVRAHIKTQSAKEKT
ncbi:hypothetical protein IMZ68_01085 [Candidatus Bathyarchaeota archaeon]|nr:hypothetical protein [Candidatus Bathyarchaeota archaeon]